MTRCFKLSPNASAHPADVVAAKLILRGHGHYEAPSWGISEYPDRELFDAIKDFQSKQGLTVDGVINDNGETVQAMALRLQSMGRDGDTILAHINPAEAELLDRVTDGGSINPLTGLPEFIYGGFGPGMASLDSYNSSRGNDIDSSSHDNMGGPNESPDNDGGRGESNGAEAQGDADMSSEGSAEGEGTFENQSNTESRSAAQHAGALQQGEEDETLGDDDFEQKENKSQPSQPAAPKEEFSFFDNLAEDFKSIFSGTTKTNVSRGSKSAYDTRAAMAKAQAAEPDIDLNSERGRALVNSFQRGGTYGPGSVYYSFDDFHKAQQDQLARENALSASSSHSAAAQGPSDAVDGDRTGRHVVASKAASVVGLSMDEHGNLIDENGNIVGNVYGNSSITTVGGTKLGLASDPNDPGAIYQGLEWTWDAIADLIDRATNPKRNQYDHPRNNTMSDAEVEEFFQGAKDYTGTKLLGGAASVGGASPVVPEPFRSGLGIAGEVINQRAEDKKRDLLNPK